MNKNFYLPIALISVIWGCTPYITKDSKTTQPPSEFEQKAKLADKNEQQKKVDMTILDTLNTGKEVILTEADFNPPSEINTGNGGTKNVKSESGIRYRIQVFASSQSERLKIDKKKIEKQLGLPVTIAYEAPYYKLYAGEFSSRSEADSVLAEVRKIGYRDAWITQIRTKK